MTLDVTITLGSISSAVTGGDIAVSMAGAGLDVSIAIAEREYQSWLLNDNTTSTAVAGTIAGTLTGGNTEDVIETLDGKQYFHFNGSSQYVTIPLVSELMRSDELNNLFTKYASNPVLNDPDYSVIFGTLVKNPSGGWYYYAVYQDSVSRWETSDLITYSNRTEVFTHGTEEEWDNVIHACNVFRKPDGTWMMLYRAVTGSAAFKPGLATSPDGTTWTRWDNGGVNDGMWDKLGGHYDPFATMLVGSTYYIYANGYPDHNVLGVFTTDDFDTVTAYENNPIMDNGFCPAMLKIGSMYYMFLPRDLGASASTLYEHGIAIYRSEDPTFDPTGREYLGYAAINDQVYDARYLDLPTIPTDDATRTYPAAFGDTLYMLYSGNLTLISLNMTTYTLSGLAALSAIPESDTELYHRTARTFSFWVRFDTLTQNDPLFTIGKAANDSSPVILSLLRGAAPIKINLYLSGGYKVAGEALSADTLYHIVFVDDVGTWYAYSNGVLVATLAYENPAVDYLYLYLGKGTTTRFLDGYMRDFRIYPRALTAAEILAVYNAG